MRGAAVLDCSILKTIWISTHAPHARRGSMSDSLFAANYISTHAPHARRGFGYEQQKNMLIDFYSRASCEARLTQNIPANLLEDFYSRASCEARLNYPSDMARIKDFYSRASCEARQDE